MSAAQSRAAQVQPGKANEAKELVRQAEKLNSAGKPDEAFALCQRALQTDPKLYQAQLCMGVGLDLQGKYEEARHYLAQAIDLASDQQKVQALRMMAVSYAFERNADKAAEYEQQAFDLQTKAEQYTDAAGTADELARIYLESGDLENATEWYQRGHTTALRKLNLTPAEMHLWNFRLQAALARIAARAGQPVEAQQHLAAAKANLDAGDNPGQVRFYPYLAGYVALYAGDYKTAIADLKTADQKDPFVLSLLAQAHEKAGDKAQAVNYYKQVLTINSHSPGNAFARPLAKEKLAALGTSAAAPPMQ